MSKTNKGICQVGQRKMELPAICAALKGAVFTFSVGFLVLLFLYYLWKQSNVNSSLHGLFYYKSATLGDSIFLPLMIGSLIGFFQIYVIILRKRLHLLVTWGVICALIGVAWQAYWLLNDDIDPNWTIPQAHYFNYAGWYHAAFFVFIFFLTGFLVSGAAVVIRKEAISSIGISLLTVAYSAGGIFLCLVMFDNFKDTLSWLQRYLIAVLVITLILFIPWLVLENSEKKNQKALINIFIRTSLCMLGVSLFSTIDTHGNYLLAVSCALSSMFWWSGKDKNAIKFVAIDIWNIISMFFACCSLISLKGPELIVTVILLCFLVFASDTLDNTNDIGHFYSSLYILIFLAIYSHAAYSNNSLDDDIVEIMLVILSSLTFKKEIVNWSLKNAIREENKPRTEKKATEIKRSFSVIQIIAGVTSIFLMIVVLLFPSISAADFFHFIADAVSSIPTTPLAAVAFFIVFVLLVILFLLKRKKKNIEDPNTAAEVFSLIVFGAVCCVICVFGFSYLHYECDQNVLTMNWFRKAIITSSVCASLGSALFITRGFYRNLLYIRNEDIEVPSNGNTRLPRVFRLELRYPGIPIRFKIAMCMVFLEASLIMVCSELILIKGLLLPSFLISTILVFLSNYVLPYLLSRVFDYGYLSEILPNTAKGGVRQDCFFSLLFALIAVIIPCALAAAIPSSNNVHLFAILIILIDVGGGALVVCQKQNLQHIADRRKEVATAADPQRAEKLWEHLKDGLLQQNQETVFASCPYFFIHILAYALREMQNNVKRTELFESIKNQFFSESIIGQD